MIECEKVKIISSRYRENLSNTEVGYLCETAGAIGGGKDLTAQLFYICYKQGAKFEVPRRSRFVYFQPNCFLHYFLLFSRNRTFFSFFLLLFFNPISSAYCILRMDLNLYFSFIIKITGVVCYKHALSYFKHYFSLPKFTKNIMA